jgi:RNA polymerase sigma-70 factor (ECF subfamily)
MKHVISQLIPSESFADCDCIQAQGISDDQWVSNVFDANYQKLTNYATGLLNGDQDAAVDAVQETFLRLCKQPRTTIESYVEPWLYRTCRNFIFDQLRQRNRMSNSSQTESLPDQHQCVDPAARITQDDEIRRCGIAISKLPNAQQEVLQLRMTHGMSYKQIADVTGMTVTNVGVTLHQAIHKLRTALVT